MYTTSMQVASQHCVYTYVTIITKCIWLMCPTHTIFHVHVHTCLCIPILGLRVYIRITTYFIQGRPFSKKNGLGWNLHCSTLSGRHQLYSKHGMVWYPPPQNWIGSEAVKRKKKAGILPRPKIELLGVRKQYCQTFNTCNLPHLFLPTPCSAWCSLFLYFLLQFVQYSHWLFNTFIQMTVIH